MAWRARPNREEVIKEVREASIEGSISAEQQSIEKVVGDYEELQ